MHTLDDVEICTGKNRSEDDDPIRTLLNSNQLNPDEVEVAHDILQHKRMCRLQEPRLVDLLLEHAQKDEDMFRSCVNNRHRNAKVRGSCLNVNLHLHLFPDIHVQ